MGTLEISFTSLKTVGFETGFMQAFNPFAFNLEKLPPSIDFKDIHTIEIGTLPKKHLYKEDKMVVYQYNPLVKSLKTEPLLIVFSLLNRPYILDLMDKCSFIQELLNYGITVYLIDWGFPSSKESSLSLSHYLQTYLFNAIKAVLQNSSSKQLHLMGVCQGGVLSLCYSCLYPEYIRSLITVSTPIDFHTPDNILSRHLQEIDIDLLVNGLKNVPGALVTQALLGMNPFRSLKKKLLEMSKIYQDPSLLAKFLCVEKWIHDSPDQTGIAFSEFIKEFYQKNNLIKDKIKIGGNKIRLKDLTLPILNVVAQNDTLIPPSSSFELQKYVRSKDVSNLECTGGHIGLYINKKVRPHVTSTIYKWLKGR